MIDQVEWWGESHIQHGSLNNRIYLMKMAPEDPSVILKLMNQKTKEKGYTKIIAKIPSPSKMLFEKEGYLEEACIPFFYKGKESVSFMGKFLHKERGIINKSDEIKEILAKAELKSKEKKESEFPSEYKAIECLPTETPAMSQLYKDVFKTYPFPIFDSDYLKKTMETHILYFCIKRKNQLVALASADMDAENNNVEMTDFATLPSYRGQGLSFLLLNLMENKMKQKGILMSYTMARALNPSINVTFAKAGYSYSGTLINNTHIDGKIESMNVWHKKLSEE